MSEKGKKFHVSQDGQVRPCGATKKPCPRVHGETPQEALEKHAQATGHTDTLPSPQRKVARGDSSSIGETIEVTPANISPGEEDALAMRQQAHATMEKMGLSGEDIEHVERAINTAWHLHRGQTRKGQPNAYIEHPISNLNKIMEYGVRDKNILAAAALHDVVEDCVKQYGEAGGEPSREALGRHLEQRFGAETTAIVLAVSNEEADTSGMSRAEKNQAYLNHVEQQIMGSQGAMLVKFSDYLDNAGTLKEAQFSDPGRRTKLAEKYAPLAPVFKAAAEKHRSEGEYALDGAGHRKFTKALNRINGDLQSILRG